MLSILDAIDNTEGIVFVYTNYVDAGIIPLQLMLEHNGYKRFDKRKVLSFPEYKGSVEPHKCKREPISYNGVRKSDAGEEFKQATFMVIDGSTNKKDLSDQLKKFNSNPEERSFIFKIIEGHYNLYQLNILDEFKLIDEPRRKEIHSLNFRLGKNVIFNSELIRPEYLKLKFYLWNLYHNENLNIDTYVPKDGNATINVQSKLNEDLISFLGFIFQDDLLIRLDIFNEFEKLLFKRENRGPFSLPMDLSNLLGVKKEKLISILKSRSFNIQEVSENDLVISKKIKAGKTVELKQSKSKKLLKKPSKKVKNSPPKKLFNNPFDQLKNINVK